MRGGHWSQRTSAATAVLPLLLLLSASALQALSAGPFGTEESRKDFEARIMGDESAWTNINEKSRGILPR